MFLNDLYDYYTTNKNITNEIKLVNKASGSNTTFRKYIEMFSGEIKWLNMDNGFLYKSLDVTRYYNIPKQYDKENDKLLKSLKVGDIIALLYWDDIEVYFKKVDDDCFIGCDKAGHISSDPLDKTFIYKSKLFKSATTKELKEVIE